MADPEQREHESQESPEDKFHDRRDDERIERERVAERVPDDFVEDAKREQEEED